MEVVTEIQTARKSDEKFQLNISPELLTVKKLSDLFDKKRDQPYFVKESKDLTMLSNCFSKFDETIVNASVDVNLKALAEVSENE